MLPNFGISCREEGELKLRVFAHACTVPAQPSVMLANNNNRTGLQKYFASSLV